MEQLSLGIYKDLRDWTNDDLMDWLSRFGRFEFRRDSQLSRDDVAYSLDVVPPIKVWLQARTDKYGNRFQDIHMNPVDVDDWNRGCPGCCGTYPDWVENHIRNHTGDNFGIHAVFGEEEQD